jgi:hypothetical protein
VTESSNKLYTLMNNGNTQKSPAPGALPSSKLLKIDQKDGNGSRKPPVGSVVASRVKK